MIVIIFGVVAIYRRLTAAPPPGPMIGQMLRGRVKYVIGQKSLASVFVKPATLTTEIHVLNARRQHCYTGHGSCGEFLADVCRDVKFVCFQIAAEPRTTIEAQESNDK